MDLSRIMAFLTVFCFQLHKFSFILGCRIQSKDPFKDLNLPSKQKIQTEAIAKKNYLPIFCCKNLKNILPIQVKKETKNDR